MPRLLTCQISGIGRYGHCLETDHARNAGTALVKTDRNVNHVTDIQAAHCEKQH